MRKKKNYNHMKNSIYDALGTIEVHTKYYDIVSSIIEEREREERMEIINKRNDIIDDILEDC